MRKFIVNVNGSSYEVEVEEIAAGSVPAAKPAAPAPAPAPAPAAAAAPQGAQEAVTCPMPGNIWEVRCKVGDVVKSGDVLLVLEAMKMENEIMAPRDCKVVAVNVQKGAAVNSGDVLCIIE